MPEFVRPNSEGTDSPIRESWSESARKAAKIARDLNPVTKWHDIPPAQRKLIITSFKKMYAAPGQKFENTKLGKTLLYGRLYGRQIKKYLQPIV